MASPENQHCADYIAHFRFLWCPVAGKPGKVTVGLALHCTRPQRFIHPRAHGLRKEDEHRTQECPQDFV